MPKSSRPKKLPRFFLFKFTFIVSSFCFILLTFFIFAQLKEDMATTLEEAVQKAVAEALAAAAAIVAKEVV